MKIKNKNRQGFTIIEILLVVAIIAILVSMILVSLASAREKAQNNSAFTSFKSIAAPAFMCLTSGVSASLTNPLNVLTGGPSGNICNDPTAVPDSNWPDLSKTSWSYASFVWCNMATSDESHPSACGSYVNGSCGGVSGSGDFCFMMQKDDKYMWCTMKGCRKEGF